MSHYLCIINQTMNIPYLYFWSGYFLLIVNWINTLIWNLLKFNRVLESFSFSFINSFLDSILYKEITRRFSICMQCIKNAIRTRQSFYIQIYCIKHYIHLLFCVLSVINSDLEILNEFFKLNSSMLICCDRTDFLSKLL